MITKILIVMVKTWFMEYATNPTAFAAKIGEIPIATYINDAKRFMIEL